MANIILLVVNDTLPPLMCQLTDSTTGLPVDLTSASKIVKAKFRKKNSVTTIFTQTCTKVAGGEAAGQVQMAWPAVTGLLGLAAGYYEVEWYIEDGTDTQTCFETTKCRLRKDFT